MYLLYAVFIAMCYFLANVQLHAQTVTWSKQIAPIIYQKCTGCHRPGEIAPFSLTNYNEAKNWADMIRYVTEIRYMPPWKADSKIGMEYLGENYLSDEEIDLIGQWVEQGAQRGDSTIEPRVPLFPTGSQVGKPDLVLSFSQAYKHIGNNTDEYRYFVLPTNLKEDKNLVALEMRPGNSKIVHHALFWADSTGTAKALDAQSPEYGFIGGGQQGVLNFGTQLPAYVPGAKPNVYSHGIAQRVAAGSDIVVQVHYAPTPVDEYDSSTINLFFSDKPVQRYVRNTIMTPPTLVNGPFVIEPNQVREFKGVFRIPINVSLLGIMPHAHLLGKYWRVVAITPQQDTIRLISIEEWDFNWQGTYYFRKPVIIPRGSEIHAFAAYDNTTDNPFNPNYPPKTVTWGEGTADEMFYLPLLWVPYQQGDELLDFGSTPTSIQDDSFVFNKTKLYPIAFSQSSSGVKIGFTLQDPGNVSIDMYDIYGKHITTVMPTMFLHAGEHVYPFDSSLLTSGMYFVVLKALGKSYSQKLLCN
jgi:hypothetical protein